MPMILLTPLTPQNEASWREAMQRAADRQEGTVEFTAPYQLILHLSDNRSIHLKGVGQDLHMIPSGRVDMSVARLCEILDCFGQAHLHWYKEHPCQPSP